MVTTEFDAPKSELLPPVEIPLEALSPEALAGVIDNFVLREGTDYGHQEITHEAKTARVRRQLDAKDVKIVFDPNTESVTLLTLTEWKKLRGPADEEESE